MMYLLMFYSYSVIKNYDTHTGKELKINQVRVFSLERKLKV